MECNSVTLTGIEVGCKDNMGGIKEVFIALNSEFPLIDTEEDIQITNDKITFIKEANLAKLKRYKFRKQTGGMTSTMTVDDTVGTQYWTTEVTLQFSKMETSKSVEINALCWADTIVIVKDSNNRYWFLGYDNPVSVTSASSQSGTNYGDLNGYTLTLTDMSKNLPYEVDGEIMKLVEIDAL